MAWGFNPYICERNQFTGAYLSVVESLSKLVAAGFEHEKAYLSFQEYFGKLKDDPTRWGKPVASVLGALMAQADLGVGAIGGKDSMSGSFEDLDVPPTLISFAAWRWATCATPPPPSSRRPATASCASRRAIWTTA